MGGIAPDQLRDFVAACYRAMGVGDGAAALLADSLVQANLWGHPSHGVMRTFWYGARIDSGATRLGVDLDAGRDVGGDGAAIALLDGQDGIGQVIAQRAMQEAIARAKRFGIGAVAVRRAGHFGTAMYFTQMAAAAGCVGYLCANASPAMPPWGGREKLLGTNPFSWAAPAGCHAPMMLDIANTAVARGKLYDAEARGAAIPEGWAIDADGRATTDPAAGIAGAILPMAGHKGYGMAAMVDVLSGVLSGSAFGSGVTGPYRPEGQSGAGFFAMAVDIASLRPLAAFEADMEALIAELKSAPKAPGVAEILYPGEPEARSEARLRQSGIDLPGQVRRGLAEGAQRLGVAHPLLDVLRA